ncbi:phage antirepressor KilAC domain-containing protein [Bacillus litorisediminis]|uniref:phage antirepressor KilAC domain-containing protein n=1 Tax=Bacillus litorisediminis TaxID=2922713 RepID=UPI001FACAAAB|nr:phage antirepressor KilAC domain-containing protein [Bacillus litorisediminis]
MQVFKNELFEVSAKVENEQILFDVEQVAKSLGFVQHKNSKEYVRWETINRYLHKYVSQQVGKGDLIPEALVYKLAFKASNEVAEKFQDWLAIEVIPSIRKHGAYMTKQTLEQALTSPDFLIDLATRLKEEQTKRLEAEQTIKKNQPKVLFADSVASSKTSILVGELAKLLKQNGVEIGQKRLFAWLRDKGYLIKRYGTDYNMPTQKSMELELFEIKETSITHSDGHISVNKTPKVTGKGQMYFINKFLNKAN